MLQAGSPRKQTWRKRLMSSKCITKYPWNQAHGQDGTGLSRGRDWNVMYLQLKPQRTLWVALGWAGASESSQVEVRGWVFIASCWSFFAIWTTRERRILGKEVFQVRQFLKMANSWRPFLAALPASGGVIAFSTNGGAGCASQCYGLNCTPLKCSPRRSPNPQYFGMELYLEIRA